MNEARKLYRIPSKGMLFGVCAGFAEYYNLDVNLVRILTVLLIAAGPGLLAYIIAAIIMPVDPKTPVDHSE